MAKTKSKWMSEPVLRGWYWWRKDMNTPPSDVTYLSAMDVKFANKTGLWYGPIKEPK